MLKNFYTDKGKDSHKKAEECTQTFFSLTLFQEDLPYNRSKAPRL